ncbi:MAG: MATE family efflux transporter [Saprospiraceae bacterium]|nr:MATE family efflux transporter [Saprospiraceae bacterium]
MPSMKRDSNNKEILKLAIPNILSNITIPLLGIVDTVLMGHEPEQAAVLIGAIGLGGVVFNAIYWNFGFLRMGTTGLTAQAFGLGDEQEQALTLFRALGIGLILGLVLLAISPYVGRVGFQILENSENGAAIGYARQYFGVRILAVPAVMCLFAIRGWFFGMQNAVFPLILLTCVNLLNVALSVYFVKVAGMGVEGVALGTVVAQFTTLTVAIALLLKKYRWIGKYFLLKLISIPNKLARFFFVNGFIFIRTTLLFFVFAGFSYYSSAVDEAYFAMNQILLELFYLMSYAVDGFAYAAESLVGKYFGAKNMKDLKKSVRLSMIWGLGFGLLFAGLYLGFGQYFLQVFTKDQALIASGQPYIFWLAVISIVGAFAFIWDGVYGGATLVVEMAISMAIATLSFFIAFYFLKENYPKHAIWIALTLYMFMRGVGQWLLFDRFVRKTI